MNRVWGFGFGALVVPLVIASCSETKLAGLGAECFQATDCEEGLICAPVGGRRVCTNDLSGIQKTEERDSSAGPSDAPVRDVAADRGAPNDANKPPDTSVPDTNPPPDTGTDTGGD